MLEQIPARFWILTTIGIAAYRPSLYLYRYVFKTSENRAAIVAPSKQSRAKFLTSAAAVVALLLLSIFIFTPTAEQFAHSSSFIPSLLALFGIFISYSLAQGFVAGEVEPLIRGSFGPYQRDEQPKRFWASATWNAALGSLSLVGAFMMFKDAPISALGARCHVYEKAFPPKDELAACNQLFREQYAATDIPADLIAARGNAYLMLGEYPDAKLDYTDAIRRDPGVSSTWFNRGLANEYLGISQRAISVYGMAIELNGDNADADLRRGLILLNKGQFNRAIADFTDLLALRPGDATALANRGVAHAWKKDVALARKDFDAARAKDPANLIVMRGNAILSIHAGDLNAAEEQLTAVLAREPKDAWSLHQRAWVFGKLGEPAKAKADTEKFEAMMREAEARR